MAKRTMTESQAKEILKDVPGLSFKNKFIVTDSQVFKGLGSLRKCAAFDCLKNYHGYK